MHCPAPTGADRESHTTAKIARATILVEDIVNIVRLINNFFSSSGTIARRGRCAYLYPIKYLSKFTSAVLNTSLYLPIF